MGWIATGLLQLRRYRAERSLELGAHAVDDSNDCNRNAGSDQAIFNGRRARFVFQKRLKLRQHVQTLGGIFKKCVKLIEECRLCMSNE
jgi:hypothetical protein